MGVLGYLMGVLGYLMGVLGYLMGVLGYLMGVLGYLMGVLGYPMAWRRRQAMAKWRWGPSQGRCPGVFTVPALTKDATGTNWVFMKNLIF